MAVGRPTKICLGIHIGIPEPRMGFIRLLLVATVAAVSVAAAGCAAEDPAASAASAASGRGGGRGGAGGAVPVTVAPSSLRRCRSRSASSARPRRSRPSAIRSQITGQLTTVNFTEGDDVQQGQVLFTLDRRPLEVGAPAGAGQPRARHRAGRERRAAGQALRGSREARHRAARAGRHVAGGRGGAQRDGRRRPRRGREREGAARVRDDQRADLRPHRRADGARGQPRARQRQTPLVVINQVSPISVVVRDSRSASARAEALPGRRRAARRRRRRPTTTRPPAVGRIAFVDNAVDPDDRHDQRQGHVPQRRSPALAGPVRQRRRRR